MTVSTSLSCCAESNPASVVATTLIPARSNSWIAPAVTAEMKSDEVCQTSAAEYLPSLSFATSASVNVSALDGVAASPLGPTVCAAAKLGLPSTTMPPSATVKKQCLDNMSFLQFSASSRM